MARLTLYDFRDADLMAKVAAEGGADGVTSHELTSALGMKDDDVANVAIRCSWMKRYGVFEFDDERRLWRLSDAGDRIVEANSRAREIPAIDKVPDEKLIDVMAHVTSRYRHGDPIMATMLRREFAYGTKTGSAAYTRNGRR